MLEGSIRVVSMRKSGTQPDPHETLIRIDRDTPWGNQFEIGIHGTRDEVIDLFENNQSEKHREFVCMIAKRVLSGENVALICWCSPSRCHGDVYKKAILRELNKFLPL